MMAMRRPSSLLRDEKGGVIVEASIILPMLLLLGLVAFEFSNVFFQHQAVTTGVRDAARYAARTPRPAGSSCEETVESEAIVTAARNLALSGDIYSSTPARVAGWKTTDVSVTATTTANPFDATTGSLTYRGPDPVCVVRVSSSYTYRKIGILSGFGFITPTIAVSHTERWIGG